MQQGNISVHTENIFPIIKKFLYSDHEIFLRELVSNAVDATQKLKTLSALGEAKGELGELKIEVVLDEAAKTLTIKDRGIGMTAAEIEQYINQIAFSGAEEFVKQYKDKADTGIIGHFGLGFYSAFMVADKVEIITRSYKEGAEAAHWICEGSTSYTLDSHSRIARGTDIILHINEESSEFLQRFRIEELLKKYCRFLPIPIQFGTRDDWQDDPDGKTDKDGNPERIKVEVDNIINNTQPIWIKKPAELKDEDYREFYNELHPFSEPPLFWIHLNVDYPFNLTGILYFPQIKADIDPNRNKIQLYSNQVFVTDSVKDIVPDFLMLLHGVIDSPDIPLNVSRSALQADASVKKITGHITKKVADKLEELFKDNREDFAQKWDNMNLFVKYGIVTDEKFAERAKQFVLLTSTTGKQYTLDEYQEAVKANQTDKDGKQVLLYTSDAEQQHSFIEAATERGYDVLNMDGIIDNHFISWLENGQSQWKVVRVDADSLDKLIDKGETRESVLNETQVNNLKTWFQAHISSTPAWTVEAEPQAPSDPFLSITRPEFDRRMKEMQKMGGGMYSFMGDMPDRYKLLVNTNHPLALKLNDIGDAPAREQLISQAYDLALLSQQMLTGKALTDFIRRSTDLLGKN